MTIKKNFESFDVWGKAQFSMWSNIRYDFELVAELIRYIKSVSVCLELLDTINHHLKTHPENVFFDGTIKCLKYLVRNNYLVLFDLPTLTQNEKCLAKLIEKYSKKLDITEVLSDIEEPTLRAMLLEYPHLLGEIFKYDNPIAGHFIGKAMLKHGITDADSLLQKVANGSDYDFIDVDLDKNSKEAMKCKIIYLGLRINNGKLKISGNAVETINQFEILTDNSIENETYIKGTFNAMYAAFYGSDDWGDNRKTHLSGCDILYLDFQLLFLPDNHMSVIYDIFLKDEVDKIGKKYFGNEYKPEGFIASLAIKMAVVIVLFRAENFIPNGEKADTNLFSAGAMLGTLNYAVEETDDKRNPFRLKKWFLDYFINELDKRVAFIKMQVDNNVGVIDMVGITRVVYLPVLESFRFFCERYGLLGQIIKLLKNKDIPNAVKDEIFINFAINIQKIITQTEVPKEEQQLKDTFILLISKTFEGLYKNIAKKIKTQSQKYYADEDFVGDASVAVIELILGFDLSKSDSFIGYLVSNLKFKMKTSGRMKKTDEYTDTEIKFEEGFLESIPDATNFMKSLEDKQNLEEARKCIEKLPEKEKEAVRKLAESNEKFNDTERKARNRGLNKIREMMNIP